MLQVEGNRVVGVQTRDDDVQRADEFVVAVGPRMMPFMKATTGVRVPVYPITGYSLTAAVTDAPTSCAWRLWASSVCCLPRHLFLLAVVECGVSSEPFEACRAVRPVHQPRLLHSHDAIPRPRAVRVHR